MKLLVRIAILLLVACGTALAATDLSGFAYHQQPGAQVPEDAVLRDESGRDVRLGEVTRGRPTILALGYFHCPNLCGVVRDDLLNALSASGLHAPSDYTLVVLSIDPAETSADADAARRADMARFPLPAAAQAWHYLTGPPAQIDSIAQAVGFTARYDAKWKQFLHPAGLVFLTPQARISGYLLGVGYRAGDVRMGVIRARDGGIAKAAIPVLLLCFHFDPSTGRYTLAVTRLLQIGCALTVLTVAGTIGLALRREQRS
jgi:protein SCO1/2